MAIDKIHGNFQSIKPIQQYQDIQGGKGVAAPTNGGNGDANFGEMFSNAIKEVDQLQKSADQQIEGLFLQKDGVTPHGAMIALEKADIAFQLMNQVRSKIVRAYEEIMRTQL